MKVSVFKNTNGPVWHQVMDNLYIGCAHPDIPVGVETVISLADFEKDSDPRSGIKIFKLELSDLDPSPEKCLQVFEQGIQLVAENYQRGVLVKCQHGQSRSSAIVLYFLMKHHNMTYSDAYNHLVAIREQCSWMNPLFTDILSGCTREN